jgi:predicted small secreted protein
MKRLAITVAIIVIAVALAGCFKSAGIPKI